jgi:glycerol kinase
MGHILAIDQGTTSSRAIVFDGDMAVKSVAQHEFPQHFPKPGWVEHNPGDIWDTTVQAMGQAIEKAGLDVADLAAVGITNQRETTVVWDRDTGTPLGQAIVWQDRRTDEMCEGLRAEGHGPMIRARTGLVLDPYFSATKLAWILDSHPGARARAKAGKLLFGTIDCFLIWRLTGGRVHATDATNASRTMMFDIHQGEWCKDICDLLDIPMQMLPSVQDCNGQFGTVAPEILGGSVPILGVAGDQQAATIGQACFDAGMIKATYGTGCFALLNTGAQAVQSKNNMLTTLAYQINGQRSYALEGSIFIAGAAVQWLRDGLKIIERADQSDDMARASDLDAQITFVPAFTGLGAPYWHSKCRGAIFGLTRGTGPQDIARAALESVGYQTRDLLEAMTADWQAPSVLRVDGGMAASDWTMQFLADMINAPVDRPKVLETTALGVAWLAGMQAGIYPDREVFQSQWRAQTRFSPAMAADLRATKFAAWGRAVQSTMAY